MSIKRSAQDESFQLEMVRIPYKNGYMLIYYIKLMQKIV